MSAVEDAVARLEAAKKDTSAPCNMAIGIDGKVVRVQFTRQLNWFTVTPDEARQFAKLLVDHANVLDPPPPPGMMS